MGTVSLWVFCFLFFYTIQIIVPKGVQEKRTEVLKNKVDRMWVSNAFLYFLYFWMNTCEVIHQWREKAVQLFVPEKFDFQCDLWQYVEHYTLQHHCAANHAVNCKNPTDLTRSSLDCLRMLVMKHFNTHNIWSRDISEPLTPKTKLSDNQFYMHCVKRYLLCANRWLR